MRNGVQAAARVVATLGVLTLAVACTPAERGDDSASDPPAGRILSFTSYPKARGSFHADELVVLDPETFELTGESLRLGDAVTTPVADPSGELFAAGGHNSGDVILVDPVALEVRGKVDVTRRRSDEVHVVGWPAADRLLGYTQESAAHRLLPGRAFIADPESGELVTSVDLHGAVVSTAVIPSGAAFLIASEGRGDSARVVLVDSGGTVRNVGLRKIEAGYVEGGIFQDPALVAMRDKVYVIGASEPVAAIDADTGSVSYHRVRGLTRGATRGPALRATGSAGALERVGRDAVPFGRKRLLVYGDETRSVRGGSRLRDVDRFPQVVDVRRWRVRTTFGGVREPQLAGRIVLGRSRKGRLVALRPNGDVLFRRNGGNRSWIVVGDRLVESGVNGRAAVELDVRTGGVLAELGDVGPWLTSAFAWPPPIGAQLP